MAESISSRSVTMKLNNGTDSTGKVKTVSASIGVLTKGNGYSDDKAIAIVNAAKPILAKTVYETIKTVRSVLS